MFELKRLSPAAIPTALAKAERYRLLNEPWEAESICLDVLLTDPENQDAVVMLILALTDAFGDSPGVDKTRPTEVLSRHRDPYARHYYAGLIHERWAQALVAKGVPGHVSQSWIREAMREYEKAAADSPAGNEEAILRWNACVRFIQREERLESRASDVKMTSEASHGDEMPLR
ncbi:MAG: hypothetical protein WD063_07870 [Pirellulales bacterium]